MKCNPDDIRFVEDPSDQISKFSEVLNKSKHFVSRTFHFQVDARQFKVNCKDADGKLTYKSGADYSPIDSLTCEGDPDDGSKFKYKAGSNWIAKDTPFHARCVQNREF